MTTPRRAQDSRWLVVLLAALTAVLALLLPATPASAAAPPAAETRVGASTVATAVFVGVHECITAGQRPVRGPSQPQIASGNCVAAEGGSELVQGARYPLAPKIQKQLGNRGWTTEAIDEAVQSGQHVRAVNKATGNPATRHVHPTTGKSVVIDDVTGQVIHVGGPGFKYGPGSGDLP